MNRRDCLKAMAAMAAAHTLRSPIASAAIATASTLALTRSFAPHDAAREAALDAGSLGSLGPDEPRHYRYLHTLDTSPLFHAAFSYAINTAASHSPNIYRPDSLSGGQLVRIDLRKLAPQPADYERLVKLWESLAGVDPYFHVQTKKKVAPYKASDGKTYDFIVGSDIALHTGPENHLLLCTLTGSAAPILRADWFITKLLSTLDGGLYYKFRNIVAKPASGTAEEAFHASLGADPKQAAKLRSDERLAMWRSGVTGKPRAIEFFYGTNVRPSLGPSLVTVTRDYFDGPIDGTRHALKNLLNYRYDGSEQIGMLPNGMLVFALFDAAGDLVDVAPQELVTDRTVPAPHTANLQAAVSCIRCHAPGEGWKDARNDIKLLTTGEYAIDIFDDESSGFDPVETRDRLKGLYDGDIAEPLRIARTTHAKAVFEATGGKEPAEVCEYLGNIYNRYAFDGFTPRTACLSAGYVCSDENAVETFNTICPPLPPNPAGKRPESMMIASLRKWKKENPIVVPTGDFEQEAADFLLRVRTAANIREASK